jgi:pyruvate/2-oxoglutarate dehydrogenase complex dihydrolipoamide dehydrogenase (E3) component
VLTTGELQQLVHVEHLPVGHRAVVVGAELVSWSAVLTLRRSGVRTVALVTEHPRPDSYAAFTLPGRLALRTRVRTSARVVRVVGHGRVTGVEIQDLRTGGRELLACDTVVFSGDWVPDHELARSAGIPLDAATRGPRVDTALRTERAGVFAAGNLLHPVDTADVAALDGAHVAASVLAHLRGTRAAPSSVALCADPPFRWVAPSLLRPGDPPPPRGRLLLWPEWFVRTPRVVARQDGRVLAAQRLPWPAAPGRVFRVPWSLVRRARPGGGEVRIGLD